VALLYAGNRYRRRPFILAYAGRPGGTPNDVYNSHRRQSTKNIGIRRPDLSSDDKFDVSAAFVRAQQPDLHANRIGHSDWVAARRVIPAKASSPISPMRAITSTMRDDLCAVRDRLSPGGPNFVTNDPLPASRSDRKRSRLID